MKRSDTRPPNVSRWILRRLINHSHPESILADYEEMYRELARSRGRMAAKIWYTLQILPAIAPFLDNSIHIGGAMIKNYLKIAFRNIKKHKAFSFINIAGLTIGLAVCFLILLWVQDELSFERYHTNSGEIYRVVEHQINSNGEIFPVAVTPWPVGPSFKKEYPEVIDFTRLVRGGRSLMKSGDAEFYESGFVLVDPSFFKMFDFEFIKGDPLTALTEPNGMVITEAMAEKYFGDGNPIGQTINRNNSFDFKVSAVIRNPPSNTHLQFDFLGPFEPILKKAGGSTNWFNNNYYTYIQLQKKASADSLGEKVFEYLKKINPRSSTRFLLQPLVDIHLKSSFAIDLFGQSSNSSMYVYIFSLIAFFILLIACINFMNLATAQSAKRAREVGMRKVVGARRGDIVSQFYGESILLTIIAVLLAVGLVYLLLPLFNQLSGKQLRFDIFSNPFALVSIFALTIITGIIAGSYPAIGQSAFSPIRVLKGHLDFSSGRASGSAFRKILVVTQFSLSIILMIGTLVVFRQVRFVENKDLGYTKDQVIYFTIQGRIARVYPTFKEELLKIPEVLAVTASSDVPTYSVHSTTAFEWEGQPEDASFLIHQFSVDFDYINTFNMEIVDGRNFSLNFTTDSSSAFILNEAAVRAMNLTDPVGKRFALYRRKGSIIGVVKDFNYKSLHKEVEPLVMRIEPGRDSYVFARIQGQDLSKTLDSVHKINNTFNPRYPLEVQFLDESLDRLYNNDRRTFRIFNYFTLIAIAISCLGLFGLATFMAQQRTKEIGIRKVLGASISQIVLLLTREFLLLVFLANVIAWPVAYFTMKQWLDNFAYRTGIGLWIFLGAGISAVLIAFFTVTYQSIRAANTNPVEALKYE